MEFKEMQKIWGTQEGRVMYTISEEAMNRKIKSLHRKTSRVSLLNETGLVLIALLAGSVTLVKAGPVLSVNHLPGIAVLLTAVYVFWQYMVRRRKLSNLGGSIAEDLERAIINTRFEIRRSRSFGWWYTLPVITALVIKMMATDASLSKWLLVAIAVPLSVAVVRLGRRGTLQPRLERLEDLKKLLQEEPERLG